MNALRRVVAANIVATYALIVYGGYVASSGSGMGCGPEWPLCNGQVVPELHGTTLVEFTHRLLGVLVVVLTAIATNGAARSGERRLAALGIGSAALLAVQLVFGAVVVWLDLPDSIVTAHLLFAMLFLALQLWLWRAAANSGAAAEHGAPPAPARPLPGLQAGWCAALVAVYIVIGLGALVKHTAAGLACGALECYGQWLPGNAAGWLQTTHRVLAVAAAAFIVWHAVRSFGAAGRAGLRARYAACGAAAALQAASGVAVIVSGLDLALAVVHLAGATLLFGLLVELNLRLHEAESAAARRQRAPQLNQYRLG